MRATGREPVEAQPRSRMWLARQSPEVGRLAKRGWPRQVVGLLLIGCSLVIGVATVRTADQRQPVVLAARDLVRGVTITEADLTVGTAHLGEARQRYAVNVDDLVGQVATVDVPAGHLVPRMEAKTGLPLVSIPVRTLHLPDVHRGDRVDIWVATEDLPPRLAVRGAAVESTSPPSGGMSSLTLAIPVEYLSTVIEAAEGGLISVVRR